VGLTSIRSLLRRRRRVVAAVATALAVVFALLSLRPQPPTPPAPIPALESGEVAVPIVIDSPAIAATLVPGDVIDVFSVGSDGYSPLVAADARVIERPGLDGPDAVVLIAVRESAGRALATASGRLGIVIRQRGQGA